MCEGKPGATKFLSWNGLRKALNHYCGSTVGSLHSCNMFYPQNKSFSNAHSTVHLNFIFKFILFVCLGCDL